MEPCDKKSRPYSVKLWCADEMLVSVSPKDIAVKIQTVF
jgi:hypothetical protein